MRHLLIATVTLVFTGAAESAVQRGAENVQVQHQATNTIDPNTGDAVDSAIAPIQATTSASRTVWIGVSSPASAEVIKQDPNRFADAAAANHKLQQ